MGFKKWEISRINKQTAIELAEECNIEPFLALMAYSRGYTDPFSVDEFFSRDFPDIDPFDFPDMEKAVSRINVAVKNGEKILIYGDYDCDGVTSVALLYLFLKEMGADVIYHIPSRHSEGYGMNCDVINEYAQNNVKLIITVDNGISALDEIELASQLGVDTIVTDHHLPKDVLPNAIAVVNPHLDDCVLEFKDFAGVGVAFALVLAVSGSSPQTMFAKYSDIVALGTVADVMPLKRENRSIVWHGLRKINKNASTGIKALLAASGAKFGEITAGTLAFTAAPRINAAGRLGDAARAVKMLVCENYSDAMQIAAELDDENIKRQKIEQEIVEAASNKVLIDKLYNNRVIVVAGEGWHEGVLGIAAAKIAERFEKPTILLSRENSSVPFKGSARTIGNFSIFNAINACNDCLVKFGGHDKAAGLTVEADKLDEFITKINRFAYECDFPVSIINIDCKLNPSAVLPNLVYTLKPLEPYGTENPKPIFGLFGMVLKSVSSIGNGKHIRIIAAKDDNIIAMVMFGVSKDIFPYTEGELLDFAVTLELKEYQGQEQLSVFVKDIRKSGRNDDEVMSQILLYESFVRDDFDNEDAAVLLFDRKELALVYRAIKNGANTLEKIKLSVTEIIDAKISVMVDVMSELGLININGFGDSKILTLTNSGKVDIEDSKILMKLKNKAVIV